MTPTEIEILKDALSCLVQYQTRINQLSDAGHIQANHWQATGRHGHSIGSVIENLDNVIAKYEQAIPRLEPIGSSTVKLNPEEWK